MNQIGEILKPPKDWIEKLQPFLNEIFFSQMEKKLMEEIKHHTVFPPLNQIYSAYFFTPFQEVKLVILGQDPYHGENEATGLCFAVPQNVKLPPSLKNLFKELENDLNQNPPSSDLISWAKQGVLLLNRTLSVVKDVANSHKNLGWDELIDATLHSLICRKKACVFLALGKNAEDLLDRYRDKMDKRHVIIRAPHPSPLSAYRGFFGSKIFTKINSSLEQLGEKKIQFGRTV